MNLSIRQLQCFREVMRSGSISEAARTLGRTQPAVSTMIANLEEELGLALFERQRGRLIRKPEAQYFLQETELILERLAHSTRVMQEVGDLQQGRLRIACLPAASNHLIPQLVADFVRDKPKVSVALMMRSSSTIEEWISSQQFDIGLAETPMPNRALEQQNFTLNCLCAMHRDDPLARHAVIEPGHLSGLPLATLQEDHPTYIATRQAFKQQRAEFSPRFELRTFQPALELVEQQLCYTISEPFSVQNYQALKGEGSQLVFRPFRPEVPFSVSILQPAHRPASLLSSAFRELLVAAITELQHDTEQR